MKFTKQDYDYLSGKSFSNGYHLKLEENPICARTSKIVELVKGSSCIHIGCCDHIPLIEKKIQERTWLHGLLERNCTDVLGIDINQEAVDYVNQHGFSAKPVYCANITAPDFAQSIPVGLEKFQFILLGEIIEHVDNPTAFLQDARKNLEEQGFYGTYIITVPNAFCMMRGGVYANGIENVNSDHRYWFTPYTIAKVMISAGVLPEELWFVNYADYPIEKSYQSDQMIIVGRGIRAKAQVDRSTVEDSVHLIEELLHHSDISGALDYIEALSPEERQQWEIQNLTGIVCSLCGQPKEARTFFEAALKQRPDDPEVLYNLADTYAALGRTRQAKQMLERCEHTANSEELKQDIAALRQHLTEQKGGRVLMVAYYFPPLSGSGVFRSIKFAKYLPMFGWEPTVISTDRPPNGWDYSDSSQLKEIPEGMEVIRVPDGISTKRETSMGGERAQAIMNFLHSVLRFSPEADRIFSKVSQSHDGIVQLLTFPCVALSWAYDVVQYIEKNLDLNEFQAVYTTSGPESAHLIGFYLKQKYGIPWVADYRDTWTFNPYGVDYNPDNVKQRLRFELESVLLQSADFSLTIEDSLVDDYGQHFGLDKGKVVSITNGYDEEDFSTLKPSQERMDKFTINYSGLLYLEERSIVPVLIAIQQLGNEGKIDLSKLRFRIVGQSDEENLKEVLRYGLEQIIDQTGYLSHSQALQANVDANLLLLLVGDEPKFKPVYTGKFFEYLRSGRPILALAPKDGAVDRVLREGGHGEAMLSTQISKIKSMILREYKKWERGESAEPLHSPVIERFERKILTQQLADVLDDAIAKSLPLSASKSGDLTSRSSKPSAYKKDDSTDLEKLAEVFLDKNYNYVWLKAMLHKAANVNGPDAVLITGSSYGVNGIVEHNWTQAINCSASSQDLYYDFQCAHRVISNGASAYFSKCIIVDGYYAACHDLSCGRQERQLMISNVYYPIFKDGHNWTEATENNLWLGIGNLSNEDKQRCEQIAIEKMLRQGTYFSARKQRGGTVFDLKGHNWWDISEEERRALGKIRAESHNKLFQNKAVIEENKRILNQYVAFLRQNGIAPVFVIAPFSVEYTQHISNEMKDNIQEMLESVSEKIRFVDFNQFSCFEPTDFVDTDHLSQKGAEKFSNLLAEMYGK